MLVETPKGKIMIPMTHDFFDVLVLITFVPVIALVFVLMGVVLHSLWDEYPEEDEQ